MRVRQYARFAVLNEKGINELLQEGAKVITITPADEDAFGVMFVEGYFITQEDLDRREAAKLAVDARDGEEQSVTLDTEEEVIDPLDASQSELADPFEDDEDDEEE